MTLIAFVVMYEIYITAFPDLKLFTTVATGGRVKFSQVVQISFQKTTRFLQNLRRNMKFTHLFDEFTQIFLQNFLDCTFSFPFQ